MDDINETADPNHDQDVEETPYQYDVEKASISEVIGTPLMPISRKLAKWVHHRINSPDEFFEKINKDRRADNIKTIATEILNDHPPVPEHDTTLAEEYTIAIEAARDAKLSNPDVKEIWRNIFRQIRDKNYFDQQTLETLKKLTPDEAEFILSLKKRKNSLLPYRSIARSDEKRLFTIENLIAKKILRKNYRPYLYFFFIFSSATIVQLALKYVLGDEHVSFSFSNTTTASMFLMPVALGVGLVVISFLPGYPPVTLTWLGKTIVESAPTNRKQPPPGDI